MNVFDGICGDPKNERIRSNKFEEKELRICDTRTRSKILPHFFSSLFLLASSSFITTRYR